MRCESQHVPIIRNTPYVPDIKKVAVNAVRAAESTAEAGDEPLTSTSDDGITAVVVENGNLGFLHRIPVVRSLPLSAQWVLARQVGNVTNVPKLFAHLRERNIVTWCLGVNNDDKLSRARAMGVDAVLTDAPEWIALQTASAGAHRF